MDMFKLAAYFNRQVGIKFMVGPEFLELPDQMGLVTATEGAGFMNDGLFEAVGFSVMIRGDQNKYSDVEGFAKLVDDLVVFGDYPHELWGGYVISAYRAGAAPAPQPQLDSGRRVIFSCSYIAQEAVEF